MGLVGNAGLQKTQICGFQTRHPLTDPSPVPLRLVKTPAAGHPLPEGEGSFPHLTAQRVFLFPVTSSLFPIT
jgi:hypothetical protein